MKGVIFTEFLEMIESSYSPEVVDSVIVGANLPSEGVYTAVGNYDAKEMVKLVAALSDLTRTPRPQILESFGKYLFGRFATLYPEYFNDCRSTFDFLPRVNGYIHSEVRKLYPDANLPSIQARQLEPGTLEVTYSSPRCMASLARGLIEGCIAHFKDSLAITESKMAAINGQIVVFTLQRVLVTA